MQHAERAHARLSPSSAKRWKACPASVRLSEGMPNESGVYAAEGTAAHELAQACLENGYNAQRFIGEVFNGFTVDYNMTVHVQVYLDYARSLIRPGDLWEVEARFDISTVHPDIAGTADLIVYKPAMKKLYVIDLKYGANIDVVAEGNDQAMIYALGAWYNRPDWDVEAVEIAIVQPRSWQANDPVKLWEVTALDLMLWAEEVAEAAKRTEENHAPTPGEHCKFCPAAPICDGLRARVMDAANGRYEEGRFVVGTDNYTPESLAKAYAEAQIIKTWLNSVETLVRHEFKQGRPVPGFKEVESRPTRNWNAGLRTEDIVASLSVEFGLDEAALLTEPELRSPAQIEAGLKILGYKAKDAKAAVDGLKVNDQPAVTREVKSTAIVPDEDPRPSVKTDTDDAFSEF